MQWGIAVVHMRGENGNCVPGAGGSTRPGGLTVPLSACPARRLLEQQTEEPPLGQPQQEHPRQSEHQQRIPHCPHARPPEPPASWGGRVRTGASRDGHDESRARRPSCPALAGEGRRHHSVWKVLSASAVGLRQCEIAAETCKRRGGYRPRSFDTSSLNSWPPSLQMRSQNSYVPVIIRS